VVDSADNSESSVLDRRARQIASHLLDVVRGESLEAGIDAACAAVYDHWAAMDNDYVSQERHPDGWSSDGLRGVSQGALIRLEGALRDLRLTSRQEHSAVFEVLLETRMTRLARAGLSYSSVPAVAALMADIVGSGRDIVDPACGFGGTLLAAARRSPRGELHGVDINLEAGQFARRRLELAGFKADIRSYDWLHADPAPDWDAIIAEPPMGVKLTDRDYLRNSALHEQRVTDGDSAWLHVISESLRPNGRAVVLSPDGAGYKGGQTAELRAQLLRARRVEAIIAMPSGSVLGSRIATCIWVIGGKPDERKAGHVLLVNARASADADSEGDRFDSVVAVTRPWLDEGVFDGTQDDWFAKPVLLEELIERGDATPQRHLATPPERVAPRPEAPGRLLTELRLEAFKSVGPDIRVPLKPLTLIYGRNSAGKSTLIQSILLMKQSIEADRLSVNGQYASLGSAAGLAHNHDENTSMRIGFSFASLPGIDSPKSLPNPRDLRSVDFRFVPADDRNGALASVDVGLGDRRFRWTHAEGDPGVVSASLEAFLEMVQYAYREDSVHPARKRSRSSPAQTARGELRRMERESIEFALRGLTPGSPSQALVSEMRHRLSGTTLRGRLPAIVQTVSSLVGAVGDELQSLLGRVAYLGPLRQAPERLSLRSTNRGGLDVPFFLLDNTSERQEVSERLQQLGVPYDLDVVTVSDPAERSLFGDMAAVVLTDTRTGTRLSPADVGFGISQVLPIVTELSARTDSVILVEQPEIHLHPAMQADLADLLIESVDAAGRANQVIAETHSESIMLRIQRRVREGAISANDIAVLYVDQDESGTALVHRLRLDNEGDFLDSWPHGFFAERFDDVFGRLT
jgi:tRNA1(Val) A37 N6-methylase TrmN6/ABC-type ATPase involved in cell division